MSEALPGISEQLVPTKRKGAMCDFNAALPEIGTQFEIKYIIFLFDRQFQLPAGFWEGCGQKSLYGILLLIFEGKKAGRMTFADRFPIRQR